MSTEAGFQKHAEDLVLNPKQSDSLKEELKASEKSLADAALDLGVDPGGTEGSGTCFSLCPSPSTAMRIRPKLGQVSRHTRAPQAARAAVLPMRTTGNPTSLHHPRDGPAAPCPRCAGSAQVLISPQPCGNRTRRGRRAVGCPLPFPAAAAAAALPVRASGPQHRPATGVHPQPPASPRRLPGRGIPPSRKRGKGAGLPPP